MKIKVIVASVILGMTGGTASLAETMRLGLTHEEKQAIIDESRKQAIIDKASQEKENQNQSEELRRLLSSIAAPSECVNDARLIETLAMTNPENVSQIMSSYENLLAPNCLPGKERDWVLVQKGHFDFVETIQDAGGASGYAEVVEFTSLVACIRGAIEVRKHISSPYNVLSACVERSSGITIPIRH